MNASPEGLIINTYTEPRICGWCVAMWSAVLAIDALGGYLVWGFFT